MYKSFEGIILLPFKKICQCTDAKFIHFENKLRYIEADFINVDDQSWSMHILHYGALSF